MTIMKKASILLLLILMLYSLILRFSGVRLNHPFWVDEYNSAIQANVVRNFLTDGNWQNFISRIERNNFLPHVLIAASFSTFGESERAARIPFVFIGTLLPFLLFIVTNKFYSKPAGISAGLMAAFSYLQITWSIQARGYILQQLISLLAIYLYFRIFSSGSERQKTSVLLLFLVSLGIGILTHNMFVLLPLSMTLHSLLFYRLGVISLLKKPMVIVFATLFLVLTLTLGAFNSIFTSDHFSYFNNLWYYHALLWREYGLITFLAIIGSIYALKTNKKVTSLLIIFISLQLLFVTFFFGHYMTKYIFPVFHLLLLLAGIGLAFIADQLSQIFNKSKYSIGIAIVLTLFIVVNGDKFVIKPKPFYSVNHDMRDIALVDFHQVYKIIEEKTGPVSEFALIETWPDRANWYLRNNQQADVYWFRWIDGGLRKQTNFFTNDLGERVVEGANVKFVGELSDLQQVMNKYEHGFIWIDDTSLPKDVINYVKDNYKEELYVDHYKYDDNPYSIWPGTLYSWGFI